MADAKSVINLGLGKIAASRIVTLTPPKSPTEKHCADGYGVWKADELEKRTWYFSLTYAQLTASPLLNTDPVVGDGRVYKFAVPNDCIRAIRDKYTTWEQRGKFIYSFEDNMVLTYIANKPEGDWPPSFINVVACRVALESVEFATQSNTKDDSAQQKYDRALRDAARSNAYVIGDQDVRLDDYNDEWTNARINPESVAWDQG